jgi:hypothetical protein
VVYAFSNEELQQTVIIEVHEEELKLSGISYKACRFLDSIPAFIVNGGVNPPPNGVYSIRLPASPGDDLLGRFVTMNSTPVIQLKLPDDYGLNHRQFARMAIHEAFHGVYQFYSKLFQIGKVQPRDFVKTCQQIETWKTSVLAQNKLISRALRDGKREVILGTWNDIRRMREQLSGESPSLKACVDAQRFWERIEGTARFVDSESAILSGILTLDALYSEHAKQLEQEPICEDFFYSSGDALIRIARSLEIGNWSHKIERGTMIDLLE